MTADSSSGIIVRRTIALEGFSPAVAADHPLLHRTLPGVDVVHILAPGTASEGVTRIRQRPSPRIAPCSLEQLPGRVHGAALPIGHGSRGNFDAPDVLVSKPSGLHSLSDSVHSASARRRRRETRSALATIRTLVRLVPYKSKHVPDHSIVPLVPRPMQARHLPGDIAEKMPKTGDSRATTKIAD